MPAGAAWSDDGGRRRFAAAFYADLLPALGAALVVRSPSAAAARSAFAQAGTAVVTLGCGRDSESGSEDGSDSERQESEEEKEREEEEAAVQEVGRSKAACAPSAAALERLLSLAGVAGGAVAAECGEGAWAAAAAVLLRRGLFADPVEALSWLAIAGPPGPARPGPNAFGRIAAAAASAAFPGSAAAGGLGRGGGTAGVGLCRTASSVNMAAAPPPTAGTGLSRSSSSPVLAALGAEAAEAAPVRPLRRGPATGRACPLRAESMVPA